MKLYQFVARRDRAPAWYGKLSRADKSLWAEVRAVIVVSLVHARDALDMTLEQKRENFPRGDYPFPWAELESLADELDGVAPNRAAERWVEGVRGRVLTMLRSKGDPWTKAHAQEVCRGLLDERGEHREAYREIALWAISQGV